MTRPGGREDDGRQKPVLHFENAGGKAFRCIARKHRNPLLGQDPAPVVLFVDEVYRGAGFTPLRREHRPVNVNPVHPLAAEVRQQGRVHVDDPSAIALDDFSRDALQVPRQDQEFDSMAFEQFQHPAGIPVILEDHGRDAGLTPKGESAGLGAVAENQGHLGGGPGSERREQSPQVAATARNTYRHPHWHGGTK